MKPKILSFLNSHITFLITILILSIPAFADTEFDFNKAIFEYHSGDYESSLMHANTVVEKDPENADAYKLIGLNYIELNKYNKALENFNKAKSINPKLENINVDIGSVYLKMGEVEQSIVAFNQELSNYPENALAYYNLAYAYFNNGEYEKAISNFQKAKEYDRQVSYKSDYFSGISNYRLSEFEQSKSNFEQVLQGNPDEDIKRSVQEYLDAINIYYKKFYAAVSVGYQYDTNVSVTPDDSTIFSDESDSSIFFFANLGYKPRLTSTEEIGIDYRGFMSFHFDITEFNIQNHRVTLFGSRKKDLGNDRTLKYFFNYYYELVLVDGSPASDLFSQTHAVIPGLAYDWNQKTSTEAYYELKYNNFEDIDERDAFYNKLAVNQIFRLNQGNLLIIPGLAFVLNLADDIPGTRDFDFFAPHLQLVTLLLLDHGFTFYGKAAYYREDYYNDEFDRVDNHISLRFVLTKKLYRRLSIDFGYQLEYNDSNSDFPDGFEPFKYDRNIFTTSLTYRY